MQQTCQQCQVTFELDARELGFFKRMGVPAPTFCWRCRMQRRYTWRNERKLYPATCSKTKQPIITIFNPEHGLTVYERDTWWMDDWSPLNFGQPYNWDKSFFVQFRELLQRVPHPSVFNSKCTNSNYCNHIGLALNSYLTFATWGAENVAYGHQVITGRDSLDVSAISESELAYQAIGGDHLYNVQYVQDCSQVRDSMFLYDCRNVHDCFGCTNLRNKSFCLFNEQLDEATYRQRVAEFDTGSFKVVQQLKEKLETLKRQAIHRYTHSINSEGSTGENLVGVNNSQFVFDVKTDVTDCRYLVNALKISDSQDGYGVGGHADLLYEGVDFGVEGSHMAFGVVVWGGRDNFYGYNLNNCESTFGCVGLRNAKYCILNIQYTKEEYEALLPKVIQHMNDQPYIDAKGRVYKYGEFFPAELSPFGYNETVAQEQFPLTEQQVSEQGWKWQPDNVNDKKTSITATDLPDHIKDVTDALLKKVIQCAHNGTCHEQCTQAFKIIPQELAYLQKHNLALPRLCPNCRHFERLSQKLPNHIWERTCMCTQTDHEHNDTCTTTFMTPYTPERPETIYCAKCYQQEVG